MACMPSSYNIWQMVSYHLCGGSFYQETQFISCYDPFINPTTMAVCHFTLKGPYCDDRTGVIQAPKKIFYFTNSIWWCHWSTSYRAHGGQVFEGFKMGLWSGCLKLSQTKGSYPVHEGHDAKFTVMPIQQHHLLYAWQYLYSFWLLAVLA